MNRFILCLLLSSWFGSSALALLGTGLVDSASPSTCILVSSAGRGFCNGVLVSPTEIRTASHCFLGMSGARAYCGNHTSDLDAQVSISKSTNFKSMKFTDDQMSLTLLSAAPAEGIATLVKDLSREDLFLPAQPEQGFRALSPDYICTSESLRSTQSGNGRTGVLPSAAIRFNVLKERIELTYEFEVKAPEKIEELKSCIDEDRQIFSYWSIYRLVERFPVPVITHPGDSGSPLYCQKREAGSKPFVAGILSGSLNQIETREDGSMHLILGSRWNPPVSPDRMESKRVKLRRN